MKKSVLDQAFRYNELMAGLASQNMWDDHRRVRLAWMGFLNVVYSTDHSLYYEALVSADRGYEAGLGPCRET